MMAISARGRVDLGTDAAGIIALQRQLLILYILML